MKYPQLPVFAFLSAILVLIPVSWHWRARNVATLAIIFWLSISNLIYGVNAIVWAGNVNNPIPVWCDITSKFIVGASYALPLATLCICKHLEMVSSSRKVSFDARDRQRRIIFESVLCFFVPMIFMVLHYIVQGHRYDIFEDIGCQAAVYISLEAVFIIWFPQLLFSVIALVYAAFALRNFIRRRISFAAHLQNSNSALTTNRYMRLIAMSLTEMVWGTTLTAYNLWSNASPGLRPWTNWADVHSNFSRVDLYPMDEIPPQFVRTMMLFWWTLPASSLIFFVFFGFGEDALKEYRRIWAWARKNVFRQSEAEKKGSLFGSLPTSRGARPLHLINLKTSSSTPSGAPSPSADYHSKSARSLTSHFSQSTVTLTPESPMASQMKKTKSDEAQEDAARGAAPGYTPYSWSPPQIGVAIDAACVPTATETTPYNRSLPNLPESDADDAETFTISTFSYYESAGLTPSSPTSTFVPPSPSPSTFPRHSADQHIPQGLPPPPRRSPRHSPSNGSVNSVVNVPGVPEDVGPSSYTQRKTLGVAGGGIVVTVERKASVDHIV